MTPRLETPRLILRPLSLADAPAVQKHFNNWNIIQHLNTNIPWPYPDDGAESFIRICMPKIENGTSYIWAIVPKAGPDEAIGIIDFSVNGGDRRNDLGDRGFWLAETYWGQGLMTEAITATNDYIFDVLKIEKFTVANNALNHGSHHVKKKTGAQFIGHKELPHHNGETKSEVWEVTRENWLATRATKN